MKSIEVKLPQLVNSKDGDILINKNGQWVATSFEELNQQNEQRLTELEKLRYEFKMLADNNKHFTKYAKSHFMVAFNSLKLKVLMGEIECDEEILHIDEAVLGGKLSVEEAIKKHPYLEETFKALYLNDADLKTFPQV